jgi:hypothetical protein
MCWEGKLMRDVLAMELGWAWFQAKRKENRGKRENGDFQAYVASSGEMNQLDGIELMRM